MTTSAESPALAAARSRGREPELVPVESNDALWLQDSPTNQMLIQAVYILDHIDAETLRQLWRERVSIERFPRFELKVVNHRGRYFWQRDPDFDLERHIVAVEGSEVHDQASLQDFVGRLADQPLPEGLPRWQLLLIEDFQPGRSVIIGRVHHVLGDGIALIPVIFSLMDDARFPGGERKPRDVSRRYGKLAKAIKAPLAGPFILARKMLWRPDRSAVHGPDLSGSKRVAWTAAIDFERVRRVRAHFTASVNDVLMAAVTGAFRRYLLEVSGKVDETIRVSMPFNVRSPHEPPKMENKFAAVLVELPVGIAEAGARLREVRRRMNALKSSVEPIATYGIAYAMLKALPLGVSRRVIDFLANKCTAVVTNVPGPPHELHIGGRRLHDLIFWVPKRADIGVGISILSFAGTVRVGVYTDVEVVPDPGRLVAAFEAEFEALVAIVERTAGSAAPGDAA